jgi:hypothetical protein
MAEPSSDRRFSQRASRLREAVGRRDFAETVMALADVAPTFPPSLVTHGLELAHAVRRAVGERPLEATLWEELLALRRGPGADAFFAMPLPQRADADDPLLDAAVEILALVDAVRNNRHVHAGQPLDRILHEGVLRTRRVVLSEDCVPVCVRLGCFFAVVDVHDEHPRHLRDRIVQAFREGPLQLGSLRARRVAAPLLVCITPLPFAEAVHSHRVGVDGPWIGWSATAGRRPMGVLAAHHLVLEGPGFATLRADFRRRVRAMRVALGLDGADQDWDGTEDFSDFDAAPFPPYGPSPDELHPALRELAPDSDAALLAELEELAGPDPDDGRRRHTFAFNPTTDDGGEGSLEPPPGLPADLLLLARARPAVWLGERLISGPRRGPPSMRYATIHRGAFSLPDFCYAYCRAQHDAMTVYHPAYSGQGFTFIVPHLRDGSARRAMPVLCSFRTRKGSPEGARIFKQRLQRQLDLADRGADLLSRVLDDALRVALPSVLKSTVVRAIERLPGDGGTFLGGRGLVARIVIPDDVVDPIARYAGLYEGIFGGSCQERGGVSLTAVDRGYRRDLCALGTGPFRNKDAMDLFWQRFAWFLEQSAM